MCIRDRYQRRVRGIANSTMTSLEATTTQYASATAAAIFAVTGSSRLEHVGTTDDSTGKAYKAATAAAVAYVNNEFLDDIPSSSTECAPAPSGPVTELGPAVVPRASAAILARAAPSAATPASSLAGLQWTTFDPVGFGFGGAVVAPAPAPATAAPAADDDDFDMFGDDDEEEEPAPKKMSLAEKAAAAKAGKKKKKEAPPGKSTVVLDVKPACFDGETDEDSGVADLNEVEAFVKGITMDGLLWGEKGTHVDIGYGIKKLTILCTVVDDLVGVDDLIDVIQENEDLVQSVDIVAFNKV
eukprot:TRINITY_DN16223_c0_g1_i2.p2 TRINITY_DN16223_c0_g1~~TRINITY_DN16223_c0_g1_i2.p2  ORF type:complete len:299 (+),score=108.12 TRINITY_DN16223_c0_g1_i2:179-1075(+)